MRKDLTTAINVAYLGVTVNPNITQMLPTPSRVSRTTASNTTLKEADAGFLTYESPSEGFRIDHPKIGKQLLLITAQLIHHLPQLHSFPRETI